MCLKCLLPDGNVANITRISDFGSIRVLFLGCCSFYLLTVARLEFVGCSERKHWTVVIADQLVFNFQSKCKTFR